MEEIEKKYVIQENGISYSQSPFTNLNSEFGTQQSTRDYVLRNGTKVHQGYLPTIVGLELADIIQMPVQFDATETRLRKKGEDYFLTVKGKGGTVRKEVEQKIEKSAFIAYWPLAKRRIEKVRADIPYENFTIEIDAYQDRDLVVAEVEFKTIEQAIQFPDLGMDVSEDKTYKNKTLADDIFLRKFIITGGPGCGKTSIVEHLEKMKYTTVMEAARDIIKTQQESKGTLVPWERLLEFQLEVLHDGREAERLLRHEGTSFLDRGIPDGIAYCIAENKPIPSPLKEAACDHDYKGVFVLDRLPNYENDAQRKERPEQAKQIHDQLMETYIKLGFDPISVPVIEGKDKDESIMKRTHWLVEKSYKQFK